MDKLELLELGKSFDVKKDSDGNYEVTFKANSIELAATIYSRKHISYFITGVYNSGCDFAFIDLENLNKLQKFCELVAE